MLSRAQGAAVAGEGRAGVGREEVGTSQVVLGQPKWEKVGGRKKRKSLEGYDCMYVPTSRKENMLARPHALTSMRGYPKEERNVIGKDTPTTAPSSGEESGARVLPSALLGTPRAV
jgi:hypothetical protein